VRAAASGRKAAAATGAEGFALGPRDAGKPSKEITCVQHDKVLATYL